MSVCRAVFTVCGTVLIGASLAAQAISTEDLLARGGRHVEDLEKQLAVVIADKTYAQELWARGAGALRHDVECRARRARRESDLHQIR